MLETMLAAKALILVLWFAALFGLERWRPGDPVAATRSDAARLFRHGGLWLANVALSPLIVLPITAFAAAHPLGWSAEWRQALPPSVGLLLDLVLLDLFLYGWHRASHSVPLLWRFHRVHHRDRTLDASSAIRFHPGEVALSACARALVIVALGVPFAHVVVFETLVLAAALFQHSNIRLAAGVERALSLLIVTPGLHWVHHHRVRADTDSTYATILSVWDCLFGSTSQTRRFAGMPIGADGLEEIGLGALLADPLGSRPGPPDPSKGN